LCFVLVSVSRNPGQRPIAQIARHRRMLTFRGGAGDDGRLPLRV
jgi:hypothetical protein